MLSRKRKMPLDLYLNSLSTPFEKKQREDQFYENLRLFYRKKWGFPLKLPQVNGKDLNLFELYEAVISFGGWHKVTSLDRWNEVLQCLNINENIQMAEHAIRFYYMQYLSKHEQNENGGDIVEEHENELLGGRSNRIKGISTMTPYQAQEPPFNIPRTPATNSPVPDFHKLIFSLVSGLPNEVSFGLNICVIMSHPGPFVLNFTHVPHLIDILVAINGIVINQQEINSISMLYDWWRESIEYDMAKFWMDARVTEQELHAFIYNPENFQLTSENLFFTNDADKLDLKKPINWRVFTVLGIFHNLSFEEVNQLPMGENKALLRFLLICCNCRWQVFKRNAYETLSNIAKNINLHTLDTATHHVLIRTIKNGLESNDKMTLLRSMEILAGLSHLLVNESTIYEFLDDAHVMQRIFTLLSLKDILICIVCLETILQISELGKTSCELISTHNSAIEMLVGMLTTDAASFGQAGLFGIKVVEVRGHQMQPYIAPNKKNQPQANFPIQQMVAPAPQDATQQDIATDLTPHTFSAKTLTQSAQPIHAGEKQFANENEFMCEWMMAALDDNEEIEPCSRFFPSTAQLLYHIYNDHLKILVKFHISSKNAEGNCMIRCRWPMCDNTPRTLWSMTTHLQDVHCTEYNLEANLRRRCELGLDEYINQIRRHFERNREREQQSGYSPYAAFEAIRRHAFVNIKKEITEDSEGPVTRNLRLTSTLILRNICTHSVTGRKKLRKFEGFLSWLSLSKMESSKVLAQCLAELSRHSIVEVVQSHQENI